MTKDDIDQDLCLIFNHESNYIQIFKAYKNGKLAWKKLVKGI